MRDINEEDSMSFAIRLFGLNTTPVSDQFPRATNLGDAQTLCKILFKGGIIGRYKPKK
jgi:hypothetical protein